VIDELEVEKGCDGINHKVKIDFVTFIEHPDEVWRKVATGTLKDVNRIVQQYMDDKAPNADAFFDYCCDACKEAVNVNGPR